jgi:hypothetical protein
MKDQAVEALDEFLAHGAIDVDSGKWLQMEFGPAPPANTLNRRRPLARFRPLPVSPRSSSLHRAPAREDSQERSGRGARLLLSGGTGAARGRDLVVIAQIEVASS